MRTDIVRPSPWTTSQPQAILCTPRSRLDLREFKGPHGERRVPVWRLFPNRLPLCCRIFNQTDPLPVWHSASNAKRLCAASLILAVGVLVGYMIRRGSE